VPRGTSRGCWTPWQGGERVSAGSSLPQGQPDHAGGAEELGRRAGVSVGRPRGASRSAASRRSRRRSAPDHVRLLTGRVLFTGDTELGEGSVFIGPASDRSRPTSTPCGVCSSARSRRCARATGVPVVTACSHRGAARHRLERAAARTRRARGRARHRRRDARRGLVRGPDELPDRQLCSRSRLTSTSSL
jgi:hypothetical protein